MNIEQDKKIKVKQMFDSIAERYDFLNHLLSFGMDFYWRKKALKLSGLNSNSILLDIACGTGDVAIQAKKMGVEKIFGADLSLNMLKLFNRKSKWIEGKNIQMAAEDIPLKNNSVTNITVAFGVRNFYDIKEAFNSFYRVLEEKGKVTIIEFRMPSNKIIKAFYKFYFTKILPSVGGLISGDNQAYKYLPDSVEEFYRKINMPDLLKKSGFKKIEIYNLTFGITQILIAYKQPG